MAVLPNALADLLMDAKFFVSIQLLPKFAYIAHLG